ncbi:MAG: sensor histidine kinase [Gemmataceae bacterium]
MKSIRLSLVVYFLLLLAVALGAVSYLSYRKTAEALKGKQQAARELLQKEYENARSEEKQRFDNDLVSQARALVSTAQAHYDPNKAFPLFFTQFGSIAAANSPMGHLAMPLWVAETNVDRLRFELSAAQASNIQLITEPLRSDDNHPTDYFQINRGGGTSTGHWWRSESLKEDLPFVQAQFQRMEVLAPYYDNLEIHGQKLRRVQLRAPIIKYLDVARSFEIPRGRPGNGPRSGGGGPRPPGSDRSRPSPPPSWSRELPTSDFQCARDTSQLDHRLADMEEVLATKLSELDADSRAAASRLRTNMLLISLATFIAVCVGASLLIGLGLAPLRRLSDAVSQVSEKDFRLHYDGPPPPSEVEPIISRLRQTLEMLQRAFDREKQATSDISHELRTPLAAMLTTLEVSLRKPRSAEEYRETMAECRDLVKQMTQLVERLLTLTWLDSRSDRLRAEPVDVGELAEQCAALVRPLARVNGLKLELHKDTAVKVTTDPDKLREVLANLMHNAIEYNRPDGSVDVSIKPDGDGVNLEVRDTGIGISPEHRDRIFERFFRADPSRQATGLHAGLGLAIVRGYVELMGGTITVESEPGRGSTFRVRIPSAESLNRI